MQKYSNVSMNVSCEIKRTSAFDFNELCKEKGKHIWIRVVCDIIFYNKYIFEFSDFLLYVDVNSSMITQVPNASIVHAVIYFLYSVLVCFFEFVLVFCPNGMIFFSFYHSFQTLSNIGGKKQSLILLLWLFLVGYTEPHRTV